MFSRDVATYKREKRLNKIEITTGENLLINVQEIAQLKSTK